MADESEIIKRYFTVWDYIVFGSLFVISASIGVYHACTGGKQKTTREFLLADRSMHAFPVAMSLVASFISAITFLGTPAENYIHGCMYWMFAFSYIGVGFFTIRIYMPVFFKMNLTSAYEGLLETFAGAGFMIGPPLGGLFYGIGGYKLPFLVLGSVCLLAVVINIFILPSVGVEDTKSGSIMKMLLIPAVYPIALGLFVGSASLVFFDPTLSVHLSSFNVSPEIIGVIFLLFGGVYGAISPLWGYVADKTEGTRTMMVMGYCLLAVAFLLVGPCSVLSFKLPHSLWIVILGLAMVGLALGCAMVPALLDLLSSAWWYGLPNDLSTQAVVSGLFNSFFSLGAFVGPTLGGYMVDIYGFSDTAKGLALINFVVMWIILLFSVWEFRCGKGRRPPWRIHQFPSSLANEETERSPLLVAGTVNC